ncbi:hypothetical protein L195_g059376, partial [Trifolium pratense]
VTYAVEKPIAFPTLLCNIMLEQHPGILRDSDVPCKRPGKLTKQRLLTWTNVAAGVGPSFQKQGGIDRVIEALKAEEAAEIAEGELDGQEGDGTSDSDEGTDVMVEDSDESSSI